MKGLPILFCLLATPIALAGSYRWVDENGQTHFGDRPPAGTASDEVSFDPPPAGSDATVRERRQRINEFLEQNEKERTERNRIKAREAALTAKNEAHCQALRARLIHLKSVSGIYRLNNEGERIFVDDEENERLRREFQARVRKECGT